MLKGPQSGDPNSGGAEQEQSARTQQPVPLWPELSNALGCPTGVCAPRGHPHSLVLRFPQQLEENIRNESALVNSPVQGFSS